MGELPEVLDWLKMFAQIARPTEDHKGLLILDNQELHKSYDALDFATKHDVIFLSFDSSSPSSKTRKTRTKQSSNTDTVQSKSPSLSTVCKEKFIHPPIKDWIQCEFC